MILIHTSVKLVTEPFPVRNLHGAILIHTSVKLVTVLPVVADAVGMILIHTSVKLVTPFNGRAVTYQWNFNPHEREARDSWQLQVR